MIAIAPRQDDRPGPERLARHLGQGDGHDFGRQDEVGPDRSAHHLALVIGAAQLGGVLGEAVVRFRYGFPHLLGALEAQIGGSEHEQWRDRPGQQSAQRQSRGEQDEQLVLQRPLGDPGDDRKLAIGGETGDVARSHRGIVDHHACRLGAGAAGRGADIVDRRGGELGDDGDVVEQGG